MPDSSTSWLARLFDSSMRHWIARWAAPLTSIVAVIGLTASQVPGNGPMSDSVFLVVVTAFAVLPLPARVLAYRRLRTAWATVMFWTVVTPALIATFLIAVAIDSMGVAIVGAPVVAIGLAVATIAFERSMTQSLA